MKVQTPDWVKDAVFYQIFPDRFARRAEAEDSPSAVLNLQPWGSPPTPGGFMGGNLAGIVDHLNYLLDLGVNATYLNPIFAAASNHRYNTWDYYQVDPLLGGNQAFITFLEAAHQRDIRVILDGVFNHVGRGFFAFHHLMEVGPESPYVNWFHVHGWPLNAYTGAPNYHAWWGIPSLPKLNTNTAAVREYLWDVATYWLEQGIDGWRLDVPDEIDDDAFWQEFRRRCKAVNPEAYIVGELWHEARRWLQGDKFDGQMNYLFTRAALGFFVGESLDQSEIGRMGYGHIPPHDGHRFASQLDYLFNGLYHPQIVQAQMVMLGSHDTPRILTLANEDTNTLQLMFLCQMTVPGTPVVYYGDEIGLTGRGDPDCRCAFPWDESTWNGPLRDHVQDCIALRRELAALRRGDFTICFADNYAIVYQRQYEDQIVVVALNSGRDACPIAWPGHPTARLQERLSNSGETLHGSQEVIIPGRSGRVWSTH
jgi:neopullulanase